MSLYLRKAKGYIRNHQILTFDPSFGGMAIVSPIREVSLKSVAMILALAVQTRNIRNAAPKLTLDFPSIIC